MLRHTTLLQSIILAILVSLLYLFYAASNSVELTEPISQNLSLPKIRAEKNKAIKCVYVCVYVWEQEKMKEKETMNSRDILFLM